MTEKLGVLLVDVPEPKYWNYSYIVFTDEYEELKRRSKRLEILERAFLECQKSEFEEFNEHPNCSFVSDKKTKRGGGQINDRKIRCVTS